jgi:hypothetical protein
MRRRNWKAAVCVRYGVVWGGRACPTTMNDVRSHYEALSDQAFYNRDHIHL